MWGSDSSVSLPELFRRSLGGRGRGRGRVGLEQGLPFLVGGIVVPAKIRLLFAQRTRGG